MIVGDILLDRPVAANELRAALAHVFGLPTGQVALVSSMAEAPPLVGVTVEVTDLEGDFPLQISVYVAAAYEAELSDVATKIAAQLGARTLVPSDSPDPYVMVMIQPSGSAAEVNVDTSSLDELGQYRIAT
jgi:hypothetical protein